MMFEGKHIHYSPIDNKLLCSFSGKLCKQRRLNGYALCIRHILEDQSAPFRQCSHVAKYKKQKCSNPIPNNEDRQFCNSHMQVEGFLPKKERKQSGASNSTNSSSSSKTDVTNHSIGAMPTASLISNPEPSCLQEPMLGSNLEYKLNRLVKKGLTSSKCQSDLDEDPYAFSDTEECKIFYTHENIVRIAADSNCSDANGGKVETISPFTAEYMVRMFPELSGKVDPKTAIVSNGAAIDIKTMNKLQTKIAQKKVINKLKRTQIDSLEPGIKESYVRTQPQIIKFNSNEVLNVNSVKVSSNKIYGIAQVKPVDGKPSGKSVNCKFTSISKTKNGVSNQQQNSESDLCSKGDGPDQRPPLGVSFKVISPSEQLNKDTKPMARTDAKLPVYKDSLPTPISEPSTLFLNSSCLRPPATASFGGKPLFSNSLNPLPSFRFFSPPLATVVTCSSGNMKSGDSVATRRVDSVKNVIKNNIIAKRRIKFESAGQTKLGIELPKRLELLHTEWFNLSKDEGILYPLGLNYSDEEHSDSDSESYYQRHWFSQQQLNTLNRINDASNRVRDDQLRGVLSDIRRKHCQLKRAQNVSLTKFQSTRTLVKTILRCARVYPRATATLIQDASNSIVTKQISESKVETGLLKRLCCYTSDKLGNCSEFALPYTRHCVKHVTYNVDQLLFKHCTAKFSDNTQCCVPIFDIVHELPLCTEHARKRDNYSKMQLETKPKKQRKKTKPSALTRPPKRGKKKKRQQTQNHQAQPTVLPVPHSDLSTDTSEPSVNHSVLAASRASQGYKTVFVKKSGLKMTRLNRSEDNGMTKLFVPHSTTSKAVIVEGSVNVADEGKAIQFVDDTSHCDNLSVDKSNDSQSLDMGIDTSNLSPGPVDIDDDLGSHLDSDPSLTPSSIENLTIDTAQASRLLEEHDFTEVLNKLPDDAFQDLFTGKNENFLPSKEETEELERALAAVDKDVKNLHQKLTSTETCRQRMSNNRIDSNQQPTATSNTSSRNHTPVSVTSTVPDEQITIEGLNQAISNSLSTSDLNSLTQALSSIASDPVFTPQQHQPDTTSIAHQVPVQVDLQQAIQQHHNRNIIFGGIPHFDPRGFVNQSYHQYSVPVAIQNADGSISLQSAQTQQFQSIQSGQWILNDGNLPQFLPAYQSSFILNPQAVVSAPQVLKIPFPVSGVSADPMSALALNSVATLGTSGLQNGGLIMARTDLNTNS